jgi:hypothetical protein
MGQINLIRTQFEPRVTITSPANDDRQVVNFTGYFKVGDVADVIEVDGDGNVLNVIADNLQILSIDPDVAITFDAVVDTTGLTGTPMVICQNIDDGQEAIDRLYRRQFTGNVAFQVKQNILAEDLNTPTAGKTTFYVEDVKFIRAGDIADVLATEGIIAVGVTVDSVTPAADATNNKAAVVITSNVTTATFTNPQLVFTSITVQQAVERNQERIDEIDRPVENEYLGVGDNRLVTFYTTNLFVQGTSKVLLDGKRMRLGTAGTQAALSQGAGTSQLLFTSLILGTDGNKTKIAVINAAGLTVAVTGNYTTGHTISVNNNSGAATALQIAAAIMADPTASRLVLARYGSTGLGVVAAFGATNLAGGLNDGLGDYAEIEQVYRNNIQYTGYKMISFHIRPNEINRMNTPPRQDEEVIIDYRRPSENVNR